MGAMLNHSADGGLLRTGNTNTARENSPEDRVRLQGTLTYLVPSLCNHARDPRSWIKIHLDQQILGVLFSIRQLCTDWWSGSADGLGGSCIQVLL